MGPSGSLTFLCCLLVVAWTVNGERCVPHRTVLVQGSPIPGGCYGIVFDAQDRLHVASLRTREIVVLDRDSGEILNRFGAEIGVDSPDDVFAAPDGSVFWTAFVPGEVGRRWPSGEGRVVANLGPGVNPITMSEDGRLFVGTCFAGTGLYEVDPDGVQAPRLVTDELTGECSINGMDFGPDGRLYGPRFFNNSVVAVDVDTGEVETIAAGFNHPAALKFNSEGVPHVLDIADFAVFRVDVETGEAERLASFPEDRSLDNLAFDSEDRLFVSFSDVGAIMEVASDGSTRDVLKPGMTALGGVAVVKRPDGGESVFVVSTASALTEFDAETGEMLSTVPSIIAITEVQIPFTAATDGRRILMSSAFASVVQVYDPEAGSVVATYGDFNAPINAIFFQGDIIVSEAGSERVSLVSASNASERIVLAEGLGLFAGLVAIEDDVWGAEWVSGTLYQLVEDGAPLEEPLPVMTGLQRPEGMAAWRDGQVLVMETAANRLSLIDVESYKSVVVARDIAMGLDGIRGLPPTYTISDVAVGPSGSVFATSDVDNVLYRMDLDGCLGD